MYQTELLTALTPETAEARIQAALTQWERRGYRLVTLSFWGADRAMLVLKKGLKGSLL